METYMIVLKCSNCNADRLMTEASAYEANRLKKTFCRVCARKLGKPKVSKYASVICTGNIFGNWTVVGNFIGNGTWIECSCSCGTVKMIRAYKLLDGTHPKQCRKCSTGNKSSNWKGVSELPMSVFTKIKLRAQNRNKIFTITPEYIAELYKKQNGRCALSGLPLSFTENGKNLSDSKSIIASLDRIDSSLGYIEGNVQWVHKHINSMKNAHTTEYFIQLCKEVVKYNDTNRT